MVSNCYTLPFYGFFFFWSNFVKWCPKFGKLIFNVLLLFNFLVKMTTYKIIYFFIFYNFIIIYL